MTGQTITETGRCECGTSVERERPEPDGGFMDRWWDQAPFVCPTCADRQDREASERRQADEAAEQAGRVYLRLRRSGLPDALAPHALAGLDGRHPVAVKAAAEWASGRLAGLALTGPVGTGKTTLAAAAARAMLANRQVAWTSAPILFARLGSGLGSDARDEALAVLHGKTALVLDDVDKARPTEYGAEQIFAAVDQRVTHGLPLMVTSNLSVGEIARRWPEPFGEAIASRLAGYCRVLLLDGPDRRTDGAA